MSNQGNSDLKTCIFVVMMVIETIFPLLVFLGIMVLISRGAFFKSSPFSSYSLQLAFCIKSLAGLVVFYLYSEYYPVRSEADTFKYFDDSYYMAKAFWEHPVDYFQMLLGIARLQKLAIPALGQPSREGYSFESQSRIAKLDWYCGGNG